MGHPQKESTDCLAKTKQILYNYIFYIAILYRSIELFSINYLTLTFQALGEIARVTRTGNLTQCNEIRQVLAHTVGSFRLFSVVNHIPAIQ